MIQQFSKDKPKVLHFIWWIPHYRAAIFKKLSNNQYVDFHVVAGNNSICFGGERVASAEDLNKSDGINWIKVKSIRIRLPLYFELECQFESIMVLLKEKPDIVICFGNRSVSNIIIKLICKLKKTPIIEWGQGVLRPESKFKWLMRKWFYLDWADAFLLYGNTARRWLVNSGFPNNKLYVVNNSLEHSIQTQVRDKLNSNVNIIQELRARYGAKEKSSRLLVHIGRLERKKNIPFLINVIGEMRAKELQINLVLIGGGREEETLKNIVAERNLNQSVFFHGPCYDEHELGAVISACDLCVVPGSLGLLAMHSLVYGTPILTCKNTSYIHCPEVEAVKEGITGAFYEENDIEDCINVLTRLLYPESCKAHMSKSCIDIIDRFYTPEYQETVILTAIQELLYSKQKH